MKIISSCLSFYKQKSRGITGWVKTVDEHGFDALRPQRRPGRPSKLTEDQLKGVDAVIQTDPKEYGLKVWDGPSRS